MSEQTDKQEGRRPQWMKKRKDFTAAVQKVVRERNFYICEYPKCGTSAMPLSPSPPSQGTAKLRT